MVSVIGLSHTSGSVVTIGSVETVSWGGISSSVEASHVGANSSSKESMLFTQEATSIGGSSGDVITGTLVEISHSHDTTGISSTGGTGGTGGGSGCTSISLG